jgi:hypothetical protein
MLEKITQVIVEGDTIHSSLHCQASECSQLFDMVNDWVDSLRKEEQDPIEISLDSNPTDEQGGSSDH